MPSFVQTEEENVFFIRSRLSNTNEEKLQLYLDIKSVRSLSGTLLYAVLNKFNGGLTQQWIVNSQGYITNFAYRSLVLDVKGEKGPSVILWDKKNSVANNQLWRFDGTFLYSRIDGQAKVLDVEGEHATPNTNVIIWTLKKEGKNTNQKWDIIPVYFHPKIKRDPFGNALFGTNDDVQPSQPASSEAAPSSTTVASTGASREQFYKQPLKKVVTIQPAQPGQGVVLAPPKKDFFQVLPKVDTVEEYFVDKSFPADNTSLYKDTKKAPPQGVKYVAKWLRPKDFTKDPKMFIDGSSAGDVIQGSLGDCWFIGALSILGTRLEVIQHCIVSMPSDAKKRGRYVFRFFKEGEWVKVEIDDQLPCTKNDKLVFGSCDNKDEIWVPLIEKAYAKLFGSYQALESGHTNNALVDLTGGVAFPSLDVTSQSSETLDLWTQLKSKTDLGCYFLSCSAAGGKESKIDTTGLLSGHAYSILDMHDFVHAGQRVHLFKCRNPWGQGEWKGKWSDGSAEWSPELMEKLQVRVEDDGTFYIEYSDFCKYFTTVDIVRVFNDPVETARRSALGLSQGEKALAPGQLEWTIKSMKDEWKGDNAGGVFSGQPETGKKNPQYLFDLPKETDVFISLLQKDYRYQGDEKEEHFCVGFHVMKCPDPEHPARLTGFRSSLLACKTQYWENAREAVVEKRLPAGKYIIIPSTHQPKTETSFVMRVFARKTDFQLSTLPKFGDIVHQ